MRPLIVIRRVPQIDSCAGMCRLCLSLVLTALDDRHIFYRRAQLRIDFVGGTVIEARQTTGRPISAPCGKLDALHLAKPACSSSAAGGRADPPAAAARRRRRQMKAVQAAREALAQSNTPDGSSVRASAAELIQAGVLADRALPRRHPHLIWFRFEWQFGVGRTIATLAWQREGQSQQPLPGVLLYSQDNGIISMKTMP